MVLIRPVSDLRYKFPEIKKAVSNGKPVYLTKNGYGVMVIMSIEKFSEITGGNEPKTDGLEIGASGEAW